MWLISYFLPLTEKQLLILFIFPIQIKGSVQSSSRIKLLVANVCICLQQPITISCCPHSNKYTEDYTRLERDADAFFSLIVPIPSNYWKNIVDTANNTDTSTRALLFSTSTMMCRTYGTFLYAAPLC